MAKFNTGVFNFLGGEVSPKVLGRVETDRYGGFCKEIQNCLNYSVGGVGRRPGTKVLLDKIGGFSPVGDDITSDYRLIPFVFSKTERYLVMIGTSTTFYVIDVDKKIVYESHLNSVTITATKQFAGYSSSQLSEIQYAQSADVLVLTHKDVVPIRLSRLTSFASELRFEVSAFHTANSITFLQSDTTSSSWERWPFRKLNTSGITLDPSGNWDSLTSQTIVASGDLFRSGHVGSVWCVLLAGDGSNRAFFVITAVASTTSCTATIFASNMTTASAAQANWYEPAWSDYRGWPRTCTFFQQRLCYGGNISQPDTVWLSETGDIMQLTDEVTHLTGAADLASSPSINYPPTFDTDAKKAFYTNQFPFDFTLAEKEVNQIQWLSSEKTLAIGTLGREFVAFGSDPSIGFGPYNIQINASSSEGSDYVQPVRMQNAAFFVNKTGQRVVENFFNFDEDTAKTNDIMKLAEHLPKRGLTLRSSASLPKIINLQAQINDESVLWALDNNGILMSCTIDREEKVYAWNYHKIGGSFSSDTAFVVSMASVPSQRGNGDDLFLLVKRTINSSTKYFVEFISRDFDLAVDNTTDWIYDKPVYMDACKFLKVSSSATFFANFSSSIDATTSGGTATGTATGGAAVVNGYLDCYSAGEYVSWDGTSNVDSAQTGCLRFKVIFNYDRFPAADRTLFVICKANGDQDNEITLVHATTGRLLLTIRDSSGTATINAANLGEFTPSCDRATSAVPDFEYVFELNYDLTAGATRLFINGVQHGSTQTATMTRDTSIDLLRFGSGYDGSASALCYFDDITFFSTVQHTADHSPSDYFTGTTAVNYLDYLEGQTVSVIGDGKYLGTYTVSSGAITLIEAVDEVLVGLNYQNYVRLANLEAGGLIGVSQGSIKRYDKMTARLNRTIGFEYGSSLSALKEIMFRDTTVAMGAAIPLFTGDKTFDFPGDYERDPDIYLAQSLPLPWQLTAIFAKGQTNEA